MAIGKRTAAARAAQAEQTPEERRRARRPRLNWYQKRQRYWARKRRQNYDKGNRCPECRRKITNYARHCRPCSILDYKRRAWRGEQDWRDKIPSA